MKRRKSNKNEDDASQPKITKFFASQRQVSVEKTENSFNKPGSTSSSQHEVKRSEENRNAFSLNTGLEENNVGDGSNSSPLMGSESGDEFLSQVDVDEIVRSYHHETTGTVEKSGEWSDSSSADEFFSQIDVEQVENLSHGASQEQTQQSTQEECTPSTSTSSNGTENDDRHYHRNFWDIVNTVMKDNSLKHLFSPADKFMVQALKNISFDAQSLFIRLFRRKWSWIPTYKIKYNELSQDLAEICRELTNSGFLDELSLNMDGIKLEDVLDILDLAGLSSLVRNLRINENSHGKKTKERCKYDILKEVKHTRQTILEEAMNELGSAFRVTQKSKTFFNGLYALHNKRYGK